MTSPGPDQDILSTPRSREENQERAFVAASRRTDRNLDARIESANRASMLHKKRTGKAFRITKEIVEKQAMYEEIDERYEEKRIRMLHAQNIQIEEQFHRSLLATFAAQANNSAPAPCSNHSQRITLTPSVNKNPRKLSLDLSNLRSPFETVDWASLTSPMATACEGYVMTPTEAFDLNALPYMACTNSSSGFSPNMVTTASLSAHIPACVSQSQIPTHSWNTPLAAPWMTMTQQVPTLDQTPTDRQALLMWQQQMMQHAWTPTGGAAATRMRQFRDRLASSPELPVQHITLPTACAACISRPSSSQGYLAGQSQPSNNFHNSRLLTQSMDLAMMAPSITSSPRIEAWALETDSTPDPLTPNTPLLPIAICTPQSMMAIKEGSDSLMTCHENIFTDFNEFSQSAPGLGNPSMQEREPFDLTSLSR